MRIGLTYDLRSHYLALGYSEEQTAEFDSSATVEALTSTLAEMGHIPVQIGHARELTRRLAAGERWDLVFNIAEGLYGSGREALIPALLDAYRIPYTFSDPCVMAVSLHKGFTKNILRDAGLRTPNFAVVREEEDIDSLNLPYPLFAKPVAEGTGKGIDAASKIDNPVELRRRSLELLQRYQQPVLVEEYLPGREFTVGILGTGVRAAALGTLEVIIREHGEQGAYSYLNKEKCEELVEYRFVRDKEVRAAEELSLQAWRVLGCRDAGRVDIRLDAKGKPAILELNPLAGIHPTHSDLPMIATAVGMSYRELIDRIVISAAERIEPQVTGAMLEAPAEALSECTEAARLLTTKA
ncbi:MAG: ATP-grasp domain-containing protein [Spirochaetaceae bacterium]|nr:MAG: ATP-grasp domain-containing protein [Spirochaetaceae bacterium]